MSLAASGKLNCMAHLLASTPALHSTPYPHRLFSTRWPKRPLRTRGQILSLMCPQALPTFSEQRPKSTGWLLRPYRKQLPAPSPPTVPQLLTGLRTVPQTSQAHLDSGALLQPPPLSCTLFSQSHVANSLVPSMSLLSPHLPRET